MYRHRVIRTWFYIKENVRGPEWQDREANGGGSPVGVGWVTRGGGDNRNDPQQVDPSLISPSNERGAGYFVLCTVLSPEDSGQENRQVCASMELTHQCGLVCHAGQQRVRP